MLRVHGCFESSADEFTDEVALLRRSLSTQNWTLDDDGYAVPAGRVDLETGGREALDHLGLLPTLADASQAGGKQLRAIYQSAKTIASTINELRNLQGARHGRTLPTGVSSDAGRYVIREASHVAELMLRTHDRQMGRCG